MNLIEKYEVLIERDASQISLFWKYGQMLLCFVASISKCPFWAKCSVIPRDQIGPVDEDSIVSNWWEYVHTDYYFAAVCDVYLGTCLSSCAFGIIWFIFFMLCGKGGHNVALYERPWRIILPAVVFNSLFTGISMYAHHSLGQGYQAFNKSIMGVPSEMYNAYNIVLTLSDCDVIQGYMNINNFYTHHDMCYILPYLQTFSGLIVCSWIGGVMILLFRILVVNDFRILKVKIYEMKDD